MLSGSTDISVDGGMGVHMAAIALPNGSQGFVGITTPAMCGMAYLDPDNSNQVIYNAGTCTTSDSFTFSYLDGQGQTDTYTVNVTITGSGSGSGTSSGAGTASGSGSGSGIGSDYASGSGVGTSLATGSGSGTGSCSASHLAPLAVIMGAPCPVGSGFSLYGQDSLDEDYCGPRDIIAFSWTYGTGMVVGSAATLSLDANQITNIVGSAGGTVTFTLTVTDNEYDTDTESFTVTFPAPPPPLPEAPIADISYPSVSFGSDCPLSGTMSYDPDDRPDVYAGIVAWNWDLDGLASNGYEATGAYQMVPWAAVLAHGVTLQVTDNEGATATDFFDGSTPNQPPTITNNAGGATNYISIPENQTDVTDVDSSDLDGSTERGGGLTYEITDGADQAKFSIDADTGVLTFITAPDFENPTDSGANNVYNVQVTVSDGVDSDSQDIMVNVTNGNDRPVVTTPDNRQNNEGEPVSFTIVANDPEGNALAYSATSLPSGLSINSTSGAISGRLKYDSEGTHTVTITVTAAGRATSTFFTWTITNADIGSLTGTEYSSRTGNSLPNFLTVTGVTTTVLYVAKNNNARLGVGALSGAVMPVMTDVLVNVSGPLSNPMSPHFGNTPIVIPDTGVSHTVSVGVDTNLNAILEASEITKSFIIQEIILTTLGGAIHANRTAGGPVESAYPVLTDEHFDTTSTFQFQLVPAAGDVIGNQSMLRYALYHLYGGANTATQNTLGNLSFSELLGANDRGTVYVKFYVDADNSGSWSTGEQYVSSQEFVVLDRKVYSINVEVSDAIAGFANLTVNTTPMNATFDQAQNILLSKDSPTDYRAAVDFDVVTSNVFVHTAAGGSRPDSLAYENAADKQKHMDSAADVVFLDSITSGSYGVPGRSVQICGNGLEPSDLARLGAVRTVSEAVLRGHGWT